MLEMKLSVRGVDSMKPASRLPFNPSQTLILAGFGALLWFGAAVLLRTLGPMGVFEGSSRALLYALIIPGTWPFILVAEKLARLGRDQIALGVAVVTAAAALLDGIALAWFPSLYGADPSLVAASGAAILWGAGVGPVLGFFRNRTT
jgi:hypothetical protein